MAEYIEREALEQHKFVSWTMPEFFSEKSLEQQAYQLGWNNAIEAIMENEPTADVIPIEWIKEQKDKCFPYSITERELNDLLIKWERREDERINKKTGCD